jgi:hypothetical protein
VTPGLDPGRSTDAKEGERRDCEAPHHSAEAGQQQYSAAAVLPARKWRTEMDVAALAELLHETEAHHGAFEAVAPEHDWWDWYAAYMDAREHGSGPDEASDAAGRYMAEVKHIVVGSPAQT